LRAEELRPARCTLILVDGGGTVRSWNAVAAELTGYEEREAMGEPLALLLEDERGRDLFHGMGGVRSATANGRAYSLWVRPTSRRDEPLTLAILRVGRNRFAALLCRPRSLDVADPMRVLTAAWSRLREGMVLASYEEHPEGPRILAANEAFCRIFDVTQAEVHGQPLVSQLDPGNGPEILARIRSGIADGCDAVSDRSLVRRGDSGSVLVEWEVLPLRSPDGRVVSFVSVQRDVTMEAVRDNTRSAPDVDPVTGLPDRSHFISRLGRSIERAARREQSTFAVIGLQIEGLSAVERDLGVAVGHSVLEAASWRARECLRPGDLVARVGEHRLALLVDHLGPWGEVEHILARVRLVVEAPYMVGRERVTLTALTESVPVRGLDRLPADAQEVMDEVELGLWRAEPRRAPGTTGAASETRSSDPPVSEGPCTSQLSLRYLPLVGLGTASVVGVEALLRWEHPTRGIIPGGEFIPDAERTGLMRSIGEWVLERACRQIKLWQEALPAERVAPIHINVSCAELWQPDFAGRVERQVRELDIDPTLVRLEVPEEAFSRNRTLARDLLSRLDSLGVELWLDGFGREGIPFGDLPRLPIRRVKLAPSVWWFRDAARPRRTPLLHGLIGLAHDLGWQVAAARVETSDQRDVLREADCDFAEGFFFSIPVDSAGVVDLMKVGGMPRA
jgi:Amt family ammonium transporter